MNLLTDGMIEKSVIKTPLNKQLRIDNHTATYEVYDIRLDHLYFNDQNDRIATWMSKYKAEHDGKSVDIYNRLREKEQIMLNAIENQVLEKVTSTEEDLDLIFSGLGLA